MNPTPPPPPRALLALPRDTNALTLNARQIEYIEKSKSANTKRAYENAWSDFKFFCARTARVNALPASAQTVSDYLQYLADGTLKISTLNQRLAAISFFHRTGGFEDPTLHPIVRTLMQGIRRDRADRGEEIKQVAPVTRDELHQISLGLEDTLRGRRDKALLLVGFACALRESNIAALNVRDLQFDAKGMTVFIRRSKTDQAGEGRAKRILHLSDANEPICPVCAMRAWLDGAEITKGAAFRKVDRWNKVWDRRIHKRTIEFVVKRSISKIGRDPREYAGHSLRAGFVTQAAEDGAQIHEIQDVTDHKSGDMVRRYIRTKGLDSQRTIKRTLGE